MKLIGSLVWGRCQAKRRETKGSVDGNHDNPVSSFRHLHTENLIGEYHRSRYPEVREGWERSKSKTKIYE